jgi:hypothetical protein
MNTRFIKATFVDSGDKIIINQSPTLRVIINAQRSDGAAKGFDGVINDDGTVTVPLHSWMLELDGKVTCDISVVDTEAEDNKKLTTTSFALLVEKAAWGGDGITSDPQYDLLIELLNTCASAGEVAETALEKSQEAIARAEGVRGVHIGGGEMPAECDIQIDPNGSAVTVVDELIQGSKELVTSGAVELAVSQLGDYANEKFEEISLQLEETRKMYKSLYDLGIELGEETISGIFDAMPINSHLICEITTHHANIYPETEGVLEVLKVSYRCGTLRFTGKYGAVWSCACYRSGSIETELQVSEWVKIEADSVHIYRSLDKIGISTGSETFATIANAMEDKSMLLYSVSTNNAAIYPQSAPYAVVTVIKNDISRVVFQYVDKSTAQLWVGCYSDTAWSGWKKIANAETHSGDEVFTAFVDATPRFAGDTLMIDMSSLGIKNVVSLTAVEKRATTFTPISQASQVDFRIESLNGGNGNYCLIVNTGSGYEYNADSPATITVMIKYTK